MVCLVVLKKVSDDYDNGINKDEMLAVMIEMDMVIMILIIDYG